MFLLFLLFFRLPLCSHCYLWSKTIETNKDHDWYFSNNSMNQLDDEQKITFMKQKMATYPVCLVSELLQLFLDIKIHPSIHFLYPLNPPVGSRGAGAYPSGHRARGGVHPGQVASPSQGHIETNETNNHTRSHSLT